MSTMPDGNENSMDAQGRAAHGQEGTDRGRAAQKPSEIPSRGWRDILLRTKQQMTEDNLSIIAAGVAFFLLVGSVPMLIAAISIYGLAADPADIKNHFDSMASFMPAEARQLLADQMTRISQQSGTAGIGAIVSIVLALWGGSKAVKSLMDALNIAYDEKETRGFFKLTLISLGLTLAVVIGGLLAIALVVALPAALNIVGLGRSTELFVSVIRWPLLVVLALFGLAVLYRYAPNREKPKWRWVSWGAVLATVLWIAGSALFSLYVSKFGNYNKTYGSLAAVIVLLMWLYLSTYVVLLGAELNAEMEHQTAKDTTSGPPEPLGERGAYVADNIGKTP